jgi:hypothetical protein
MNKTLMLVICDFLLLSMLAIARFDPPEEAPAATLGAAISSASAEAELISLLEESLQSELQSRSSLSENLAESRENLQEKARLLAEREAALQKAQQSLEQKTREAEQLAAGKAGVEAEKLALATEKTQLETERLALAQKFETTRTQLDSANTERLTLTRNAGKLREESSVTKQRLSQAEEALIAKEITLAEREAALKAAQAEALQLTKESEQLSRRLEVAQAERILLDQNLTQEQLEKSQLQQEKAQAFARADRLTENVSELGQGVSLLGKGVTTLTKASEEIKQEMNAARPRTMSEIFTRFQKNRALIRFTSTEKPRRGGPVTRLYESKSILISDTQGDYLVTHSADTPFAFSKDPRSIRAVQLEVTLAGRTFPLSQIAFLSADPRLIFIPLPKQYVDSSGLETFELALQPERWEEVVLIKNDESNFGRTGFRRLTSSDRFLKMDRPALGELFADFASSRGDLAFSKNSQFIGVLSDNNHAVVIDAFLASGITNLGANFNTADNAAIIDRLNDRVSKLPVEVR